MCFLTVFLRKAELTSDGLEPTADRARISGRRMVSPCIQRRSTSLGAITFWGGTCSLSPSTSRGAPSFCEGVNSWPPLGGQKLGAVTTRTASATYVRRMDHEPDTPSSNRLAVVRRKLVRVIALFLLRLANEESQRRTRRRRRRRKRFRRLACPARNESSRLHVLQEGEPLKPAGNKFTADRPA